MDESLEREGYEYSNAIVKCPVHLCELDEEGDCPVCVFEAAQKEDE